MSPQLKSFFLHRPIYSLWSASALMVACQVFFQFAGCPREFWCDQSGAFNSDSFRAFAEALGIKICYSSAEYPQSNGAAESAVKFLKRLRAAAATVFDLFRAILYLQNTVKRAKSASPAQIFLGRAVRTPLREGDGRVPAPRIVDIPFRRAHCGSAPHENRLRYGWNA